MTIAHSKCGYLSNQCWQAQWLAKVDCVASRKKKKKHNKPVKLPRVDGPVPAQKGIEGRVWALPPKMCERCWFGTCRPRSSRTQPGKTQRRCDLNRRRPAMFNKPIRASQPVSQQPAAENSPRPFPAKVDFQPLPSKK
jgi:hypothetical protein